MAILILTLSILLEYLWISTLHNSVLILTHNEIIGLAEIIKK